MKAITAFALAAVAVSMVGCKSTLDDRWRSDMDTTLEDAHFRPVYEVQKEKGIVSGQNGEWLHFDYVPGEKNVRTGPADVTGKLCVIGSDVKKDKVKELFGI